MDARSKAEILDETWGRPSGVIGWLSQVNHKAIGIRFMVTAFGFFFLGGIAALVMRTQLAQVNLSFLAPDTFNQLFTTHGTTMMFLFAIPVMEAVGMYFVPLMIGARDLAFPWLGAFGYWVCLIAGATIWVALLTGNGPDAAWFNYVPLADSAYSPGYGIDVWTTAITFIEILVLVAAVELIVTIFKMRVPGMSLNRMPLFVWAILVILSGFTMTNVGMLLLSGSTSHPDGVGNNQGMVGKNYTYQLSQSPMTGFFEGRRCNQYMGNAGVGVAIHDFNADNFDHSDLDFIGGASITPAAAAPGSH